MIASSTKESSTKSSHSSLQRNVDKQPVHAISSEASSFNTGYLSRLIQNSPIQAKLKVDPPDSPLEQEADMMSGKVMSSPASVIQTAPAVKEEPQTKLQRQEDEMQASVQLQGDDEEVQTRLHRQEEEEPQAKLQLKQEEEEVQAKAADGASVSDGVSNTLTASKTGGTPLSADTRSQMEPHFGADFSNVHVHTDTTSVQMNQELNAQAFTHGNHIYFGEGKFNPGNSDGKSLIAHELTHVAQQGAAPAMAVQGKTKGNASAKPAQPVQRSLLDDALGAISDAASSATEFVGDSLDAGLDWVKDKFKDFVQEIPGYKLLSVVLGSDPVTGAPVPRNGRNFIEAGLNVIPGGMLFQKKLEETGALQEAGVWLDGQIANLDISLTQILRDLEAFWDSLSLSDVTSPGAVLERAANVIKKPVAQIVTFAVTVAVEFLRIIKRVVLSELVLFIRDQTRGYPLLTVILGKDPITEEPVERNGMNLIRGFMMLSADGEEQLRQMEESGSLQRAADWIDGAVARLDLSWESLRNLFAQAWNLITIENLMTPIDTYMQLLGLFLEPAGRIVIFLFEVGLKILEFIKDALVRRLIEYARTIPGYVLLTVILGKDPFSEEPVERSAENIIHGFMNLMPGGEEQFQQMKETGAIQRAVEWIEGAIARLDLTWTFIKELFLTAWNSLSLQDLAAPIEAFIRIMNLFIEPIGRLLNFVKDVVFKMIEIILIIMNFPIDLISNIISKSIQAFKDIMKDPIAFLKNILKAIKQGFTQFFSNILKHLLGGLTGWLFGELETAGITPPPDLSLKSILGLVMQILGITAEKIWKKLGDRIGHDKVEKIRGVLDTLTGVWAFVRDVMTRGPVAIWEYVVEKLSDLWNLVLGQIRNWVMTKIIEQITVKLLSLLDPTGIMAVVNSVIALYKAVQSFIQYLREMLEIVNSFVEGVAEIAKGDVNRAADFLENSLSKAMPIAIGFLANQVGLGGLGKRIGEMIQVVQAKVDSALDWLIDKAVSAGTAFLNMLKSGVSAVKEGVTGLFDWWKKKETVHVGNKKHQLYFDGDRLIMASTPTEIEVKFNEIDTEIKNASGSDASNERKANIGKITATYGELKELYGEIRKQQRDARLLLDKHNQGKLETPLTPAQKDQLENARKMFSSKNKDGFPVLLGTVLSALEGEAAGLAPQTEFPSGEREIKGIGVGGSVAKKVIANPLSIIRGTIPGSAPEGSIKDQNVEPYKTLSYRKTSGGKRPYYAAGHFISEALHGPGKSWNLSPMARGSNTSFESSVEKPVKEIVWNKAGKEGKDAIAAVHYSVEETAFGRSPALSDSDVDTKYDPNETLPSGKRKGESKRGVAKDILSIERELPSSLKVEVTKMEEKDGAWSPTTESLFSQAAFTLSFPSGIPDFGENQVSLEDEIVDHIKSLNQGAKEVHPESDDYLKVAGVSNRKLKTALKRDTNAILDAVDQLLASDVLVREGSKNAPRYYMRKDVLTS